MTMTILELIKKYLPNDDIKIFEEGDKTIVIFNNRKSVLSITNSSKWNEVKKYIDLCIKSKTKGVSCNKCTKDIDINTYIDIIRNNSGLYKCPFCDFTFGKKMNKFELDNLEYMVYIRKCYLSTISNL